MKQEDDEREKRKKQKKFTKFLTNSNYYVSEI